MPAAATRARTRTRTANPPGKAPLAYQSGPPSLRRAAFSCSRRVRAATLKIAQKNVCSERLTLDDHEFLWQRFWHLRLQPSFCSYLRAAQANRRAMAGTGVMAKGERIPTDKRRGSVSCGRQSGQGTPDRSRGREGNDVAMTKSELIQHIADLNPHLYHRDVERIVTTIFDEISEALSRGDRVELRGFGAFSVKKREARVGRNPRTGAAVSVSEKHVPFFKTGKQLRERLNGREG